MNLHELQHRMYELPGPSVAQRITLAWFAAVWVASVWWLLFGGGLKTTSGWFGRPRKSHERCVAMSNPGERRLRTDVPGRAPRWSPSVYERFPGAIDGSGRVAGTGKQRGGPACLRSYPITVNNGRVGRAPLGCRVAVHPRAFAA